MKKDITITKLRELCEEFNLKYKESEDDYFHAYFKDDVITNDVDKEGSLIDYCWLDYVLVKTGLYLWYNTLDNSMKIIWDDEYVTIDNMKELRKYCKNITEQYELFKLYKKQFKQNTRIKNISEDF